jgi:hypothetical protein
MTEKMKQQTTIETLSEEAEQPPDIDEIEKNGENIYDYNSLEIGLENDMITDAEEGFMIGYVSA